MTVSIHTRTGNINTFFRSINPYAQWLSQYIHSVAILVQSLEILNHMPSDYLNTYTHYYYYYYYYLCFI